MRYVALLLVAILYLLDVVLGALEYGDQEFLVTEHCASSHGCFIMVDSQGTTMVRFEICSEDEHGLRSSVCGDHHKDDRVELLIKAAQGPGTEYHASIDMGKANRWSKDSIVRDIGLGSGRYYVGARIAQNGERQVAEQGTGDLVRISLLRGRLPHDFVRMYWLPFHLFVAILGSICGWVLLRRERIAGN